MLSARSVWLAIALGIGGLLNGALILLPAWWLGSDLTINNVGVTGYLFLTLLVFGIDTTTIRVSAWDQRASNDLDRRQFQLALITAILVWGVQAIALAEGTSRLIGSNLPGPGLHLFGSILIVAGCVLRQSAILALRAQFTSSVSIQGPERHLFVEGIFNCLRHPSETGLLLIAGGCAVYWMSWIAAVLTVLLIGTSLLRIYWEDQQLERAWGEAFIHYRQQVPALVPSLLKRSFKE